MSFSLNFLTASIQNSVPFKVSLSDVLLYRFESTSESIYT